MAKNKGKNLFDDEIEIDNSLVEESVDTEDTEDTGFGRRDKIFGNAFNTGDIEFEVLGKIKVQDDYNYFDPEFSDNSHESFGKGELQKELYELFEHSPYYEKYTKIKRVPKNDMLKIYYYFAEPLRKKNKYTLVEIFTEVCGFMSLNFKEMFHLLLPLDKQLIIKELDDTFDILKRRKIKKLF
jgi:hypothetical protein